MARDDAKHAPAIVRFFLFSLLSPMLIVIALASRARGALRVREAQQGGSGSDFTFHTAVGVKRCQMVGSDLVVPLHRLTGT